MTYDYNINVPNESKFLRLASQKPLRVGEFISITEKSITVPNDFEEAVIYEIESIFHPMAKFRTTLKTDGLPIVVVSNVNK